jgi:hypothetical protein
MLFSELWEHGHGKTNQESHCGLCLVYKGSHHLVIFGVCDWLPACMHNGYGDTMLYVWLYAAYVYGYLFSLVVILKHSFKNQTGSMVRLEKI